MRTMLFLVSSLILVGVLLAAPLPYPKLNGVSEKELIGEYTLEGESMFLRDGGMYYCDFKGVVWQGSWSYEDSKLKIKEFMLSGEVTDHVFNVEVSRVNGKITMKGLYKIVRVK